MKKVYLAVAVLACCAVMGALAQTTLADTMLVDRGLPTANLNNAAGASRSNVAWADSSWVTLGPGGTVQPTDMVGDDFTLPAAAGSYNISDIRVWVVGDGDTPFSTMYSSISLAVASDVAGDHDPVAHGSMWLTTSNPAVTLVTYSDGSSYQGYMGGYSNIYQLDFPVNITAPGGSTLDFGFSAVLADPTNTDYGPYLHASNGPLSGSPQQGSDNVLYGWLLSNGGFDWSYNSGTDGGWDKGSNVNVQVFGNSVAVPEPSSIVLLVAAGLGAIVCGWRRRK